MLFVKDTKWHQTSDKREKRCWIHVYHANFTKTLQIRREQPQSTHMVSKKHLKSGKSTLSAPLSRLRVEILTSSPRLIIPRQKCMHILLKSALLLLQLRFWKISSGHMGNQQRSSQTTVANLDHRNSKQFSSDTIFSTFRTSRNIVRMQLRSTKLRWNV